MLPDEPMVSAIRVSSSSDSRAMSGDASACSITRNASIPSANDLNDQPS